MRHLTPVLLLATGVICTPVYAESVVPNFTKGTINSTTETTTKVVETIRQVEYSTGTSYTVSGTNINIPGRPSKDANYTIQTQGAAFQFSETFLDAGKSKETWIDRTTEQKSVTNSTSVFTQ